MDKEKLTLKLIVAHVKCLNCGAERNLYFTSNNTYGERVVFTKSGNQCAYVNLFGENIVQELEKYCTELYMEHGISVTSNKLARIVSSIYGITCDEIGGEKVDTISNTKCPNCLERKLIEDDKFGEQLMEIDALKVTHESWEILENNDKKERVKRELVRQGYLKEIN